MTRPLWKLLALGALLTGAVMTAAQPPEGRDKGKREGPPPGGRPDGPPRFQLGRVLPPFVVDQLELTREQRTEIAKLEKEVKQRLEKILTAEQRKKLETLRPPRPGGPDARPDAPPPGEGGRRTEKKKDRP